MRSPGVRTLARTVGAALAVAAAPAARADSLDELTSLELSFAAALQEAPEALDKTALAKETQNPVADLISLPLQNNTSFGVGPDNEVSNVLNIQPVIPADLGEWVLINRIILPVVYQPEVVPGQGAQFGLGDTNYTLFFSPKDSGGLTWGIGKWSLGPSVVLLVQPDPWVMGVLWRQVWSIGGDTDRGEVNQMLLQHFVNYNLPDGWYLTSAPIITVDWNADSGNRWVVPMGGGFGKIFRIGDQPMNAQFQAFYNVKSTDASGEWSIRFQVQFLFPK
jgi:hypothetical protein